MNTRIKPKLEKNNSGITLVALIITIIILIILAAVTIKTLYDENLVGLAIKAGEDYKQSQGYEMDELGKLNNRLENTINVINGGNGSGGGSEPTEIVGAIAFGNLSWSNGKASVSITKNSVDSYTIEYKVTNKNNVVTREYAPITSGETITDLNLGDLVTARLTDGTNHSKPADLNVEDKNAPQVELKLKEGTTAIGKTAVVVATVIEEESGVASYKFEYKLSTEGSYKSDSNGTIPTSDKTKEYEYTNLTEAVENNLQVTVTDNAGNTKTASCNVTPEQEVVLDTEADPSLVGKTVVYTPDNDSFSTTVDGIERSGYGEQTFSTETFTWKLWKTDSEYIYLISDRATSSPLTLKGVNGYNNGVTLLDDICNACYSNSTYGATARNLKIEDVVDTAGMPDGTDVNGNYGTQPYSYSFGFPKVWVDNESTVEKAKANVSVAYAYTEGGSYQTSSPTITFRYYDGLDTNLFETNYGDLVVGNAVYGTSYWLSSRSVSCGSYQHLHFGLLTLYCGRLEPYSTYGQSAGTIYNSHYSAGVRPLVSSPLANVTVTEEADGTFTLSKK